MQLKIFVERTLTKLEEAFNEWMNANQSINISDIKYHKSDNFILLVFYKPPR